jgi:uncharacterized protein with HEPN domain
MSRDDLRIADYLGHMLEAIRRIGEYTDAVSYEDFLRGKIIQDAVLRNIEILGEAARNIEMAAPDFAAAHSEVPWAVIYAMRNRIAHGYFQVDLEIVWKSVRTDLPKLKLALDKLL